MSSESSTGMKRTLNAFDLTLLGVGCIMGTGIFVLTGRAAAVNAGPAVILSFVAAGIAATLGALCYAEMASMIPLAGSAYTYAYATMGQLAAFIIGWDLLLEWLVGAAAVSVGWSGYVTAFLKHTLGFELPKHLVAAPVAWNEATGTLDWTGAVINLPAVFIVLAMTFILVLGARESAKLNAIIVLIKVSVVLIFIVFASRFIKPELWHPFIPENTGTFGQFGVSGVLQGATMVFFAYLGFDAVSVAAQETKNPKRDVPIGIFASLMICTVLYIAVSMVLTGIVPYQKLSVPYPIALGVQATGLGWLETVVELGAIAGLTSVVLVQLFAQPRILFTMARDGFLPSAFGKVHPRFGTPHVATICTGLLCALGGGLLPIEILAELTSIGTLFAFVIVSAGVMVLRVRRPDIVRKFRVPGGPYLIPILSMATSGLLMGMATTYTLYRLLLWLVIGLALYVYYGHRQAKRMRTEATPSPA